MVMRYWQAIGRATSALFGSTEENRKAACVIVATLYGVATSAALVCLSSARLAEIPNGVAVLSGSIVAAISAAVHVRKIESIADISCGETSPGAVGFVLILLLPILVSSLVALIYLFLIRGILEGLMCS